MNTQQLQELLEVSEQLRIFSKHMQEHEARLKQPIDILKNLISELQDELEALENKRDNEMENMQDIYTNIFEAKLELETKIYNPENKPITTFTLIQNTNNLFNDLQTI